MLLIHLIYGAVTFGKEIAAEEICNLEYGIRFLIGDQLLIISRAGYEFIHGVWI